MRQRVMTNGRMAGATRIVRGYVKAKAGVAVRIGGFECTLAGRSIFLARGVIKQRLKAIGSVVVSGTVVNQRKRTGRGVLRAGRIAEERPKTGSRVVVGRSITD